MTIKSRLNLIRKDWAHIFSIKKGKIIEKGNDCYQVNKIIGKVFNFYYYSGLPLYILIALVYFFSFYFESFYIMILISFTLYTLIEFFIYLIIPIYKVKCWQTYQ